MTFKEHHKKNLGLAWPVVLGQMGHVMVGLADSIMIGKLGTVPLAASAFANSIFIIVMVFGIGMAYGLTTPVANADGEGKPEKARSYLKHGIYLNGAVALSLFTILLILQPLMPYLGQEKAVWQSAGSYYQLISYSIIPLLGYLTFKQFAEGLSDTRAAMAISLGANFLNIGLNYLLIYGNWGLPALGLEGAGLATLLARSIMFLSMAIYVFKKPAFKAYTRGMRWQIRERAQFKKLIDIGLPSGLQYLFEVSAFALAAVMAGWLGAEALAAHQIAISLASLSYMAASGFSAAANVRVSNLLGAQKYLDLRRSAYSNFGLTLVLMIAWGLLFLVGRDFFPSFYSKDPVVLKLAAQLLSVAVAFQIFDGLQTVALGALRGLAETRLPTFIALMSYWPIGLGTSYLLGFKTELATVGIWLGLALGLIFASVLLTLLFNKRSKKLALMPHE